MTCGECKNFETSETHGSSKIDADMKKHGFENCKKDRDKFRFYSRQKPKCKDFAARNGNGIT